MAGRLLLYRDGGVLVALDGDRVSVPRSDALRAYASGAAEAVGEVEGEAYACAELEGDVPHGHELRPLRALHGALGAHEWLLAGRGAMLVEWLRSHRFCGRCGAPTSRHERSSERALVCRSCDASWYPRLAPAVIALITHADRVLLARHRGLPPGLYSTLAGFVEPGESLEEALAREIREEVGIDIRDIRYFGSQSWPFPHSLMVAFTAEAVSDTIVVDTNELEHADWYRADAMPRVAPRISIARALIDHFVRSRGIDPDTLNSSG